MKKIFLAVLMIIVAYDSNSQTIVDSNLKFKMLLFLNLHTQQGSYSDFEKSFDLSLDTLKLSGDIDYTELAFATKFEFYKIELKKSIRYKIAYTKDSKFEGFPQGYTDVYIIGVNMKNNRSYRLHGFDDNDFLAFLTDFLEEYNDDNIDKITVKKFLKNYKVEGLDFKCLYQGLKHAKIDREKYPCLKRVSDPVWIR